MKIYFVKRVKHFMYFQVAVGQDHVICVTIERMIYTWGDNSKGQLGHGDLEYRNKPQLVEALKGKSIIR